MILRDHHGHIQASTCCNKPSLYKPVVAKALALRVATDICNDLGFSHVIFKGDCKEVVEAAISGKPYESKLYHVIFDIKSYLWFHPHWKIQFSYRESNRVAHSSATLACTLQGDSIWMKECPMQIISVKLFVSNENLFTIKKILIKILY